METREVKIGEVKSLVGSLLTVTEAICPDKNQREAAKILVKQTVFRWFSQGEISDEKNVVYVEHR